MDTTRVTTDSQADAQLTVHLGAVLRRHRIVRNLTQSEAAIAAGLTRNSIASLEKSARPDPHLSTLLALMSAYGLGSIEELLGEVPSFRLQELWERDGWRGGRPSPPSRQDPQEDPAEKARADKGSAHGPE